MLRTGEMWWTVPACLTRVGRREKHLREGEAKERAYGAWNVRFSFFLAGACVTDGPYPSFFLNKKTQIFEAPFFCVNISL